VEFGFGVVKLKTYLFSKIRIADLSNNTELLDIISPINSNSCVFLF
jgi:hypothetical protein